MVIKSACKRLILVLGIFSIFISTAFGSGEDTPEKVLRLYIEAVKNEQWCQEGRYWLESTIERSRHLGITYDGIEAKYDCASPLIFDHTNVFATNRTYEIIELENNEFKAKLEIKFTPPLSSNQPIYYYLHRLLGGDGWYICSSLDYYNFPWKNIGTEYFNIYYTDSTRINDVAIERLGQYTDSLLVLFEVSQERIKYLKEKKIDYYFCTEYQILQLTGYDAQGMTSLPYDAIVTQHIPHTHELTHLLINYALKDVPLFTLPTLQEGLACHLGGRWGKSADIIDYWGAACLKFEMFSLDDILTNSGFYSCPAGLDGAYAVASLFVGHIIESYGFDTLKKYYRQLSGDKQALESFSKSDITSFLTELTGNSWEDFTTKFSVYAKAQEQTLLQPVNPKDIKEIHISGNDPGNSIIEPSISENENSYNFAILVDPGFAKAAIYLKSKTQQVKPYYRSWQYDLYNENGKFDGYAYGIQFSPGEIGLYDYLTNEVTAKHVQGFFPSEYYFDQAAGMVYFRLDKSLIRGELSDYGVSAVALD